MQQALLITTQPRTREKNPMLNQRPVVMSQRLGEMLKSRGLIADSDINKALAFQQQFGGRIGNILVRLGALSEESLLQVLSVQLGMPILQGAERPMDADGLRRIIDESGLLLDWWMDNGVVAWAMDDGQSIVVARDPLDPVVNETLGRYLASRVWEWRLLPSQELERYLDMLPGLAIEPGKESYDDVSHLRELAEEAPVIELVNNVLAQAMDSTASDVHIEPEETLFHVRMRIDGILQTRMTLPISRYPAVASRIKLISGMDIAERRLPQDGRLTTRVSGRDVDIRVSSVPAVHGESLVMRLLPKERADLSLASLGMASDDLTMFRQWAKEPHGVILVTGPTGSGKSTTLYATLDEVNDRDSKIITVEDPVEYQLAGITQIQANADIGYTFARALRAILRQDPDVIMIGEIRDLETAQIAVQSSLTGHLVLSTLHTNDAVSAFTRLVDMGLEPFLVATSVRAVQAQRLVRRLCRECAKPAAMPGIVGDLVDQRGLARMQAMSPPDFHEPVGCQRCQGTGYRGRVGIYELVGVTPGLQKMIMAQASAEEMREQLRASEAGMRTLREDGLLKAWQGVTSVDEVLRVTGGGDV